MTQRLATMVYQQGYTPWPCECLGDCSPADARSLWYCFDCVQPLINVRW